MNVLQLSLDDALLDEATAAGGEARRRQLAYAEELQRRVPGSSLHIVVRSAAGTRDTGRSAVVAEGLAVRSAPASAAGFVAAAYGYGRALSRERGLHLVTSQTPFVDGLAGRLLRSRCSTRWLVQLHTSRLDDPYWLAESRTNGIRAWLGKRMLQRADAVRVVSQSAAAWLQRTLGVAQERVYVVPVGTPYPLFGVGTALADEAVTVPGYSPVGRLAPAGRDSRPERGSSPPGRNCQRHERSSGANGVPPLGGQSVAAAASPQAEAAWPQPPARGDAAGGGALFVGRLVPQKGVSTLLRAMEHVPQPLLIVGDGPERQHLETLAATLGLQDRVRFAGMVPYEQLPSFYGSAGVVVVPSQYEPYGRVIVEAMAFGRAVVATDTDGARDLIRDGETGLIVPIGDVGALADKMRYLLSNPEVAARMGGAARQFVRATQDPHALCRAQVDMWLQVAGGAGR